MLSITTQEKVKQIIECYDAYSLHVARDIKESSTAALIQDIEREYDVDSIQLSDGTKIWNLLRIFICDELPKLQIKDTREGSKLFLLSFIKESILPLSLPKKKGIICGFSSTESRKKLNGKYYDIYLDPLYEILNDDFAVFEWPSESGRRRKYIGGVYSKIYVPMHISLYTKIFWNILFFKISKRKRFKIISEKTLLQIVDVISTKSKIEKTIVKNMVYEFITIFYYIKQFLYSILVKIKPKAVLIRCGYGRFSMALSQACRQLHIPSIELQHGLITSHSLAYKKATATNNKDCLPEYFLTHGEAYTEIVKNGNLFDKEKVISIGHPYLENNLKKEVDQNLKKSISSFKYNILVTSQWTVSAEIKSFFIQVAKILEKQNMDIGILFKSHPYEKTDYLELKKYKHIVLIDRYEDIFKLFTITDIHSTVYSTSGLEAMAFGIPNIFVDICSLMGKTNTKFIVNNPEQFINVMQDMISDSKNSRQALEIADMFYKSASDKNLKNFFTKLGVI